jgi:hypothetical protein
MGCCTRLAWRCIAGPAPRLRRTPQEPAPPVHLGAQAHGTWKGYVPCETTGRSPSLNSANLRNMSVLLEEARVLARHLAYHRRATLEAVLGQALDEADRHIEDLRTQRY